MFIHYIKVLNQTIVTVRQDFLIGGVSHKKFSIYDLSLDGLGGFW